MRPKIERIKDNEVTDNTYYEDCMYMSNSMLKTFIEKCPKYYVHRLENPIRPTAAMKFGTAFHMLMLEGVKKFKENYIEEPDVDKRTTLGKSTLIKFNERLGDKQTVSRKDNNKLLSMYQQLQESKHYSLIDDCNEIEQIYLWKNKDVDMLCKGKLDAVNTKDKYIVDLKTTRNASPENFTELIMNAKYHMQAAYYLDALGYDDYYIVAIEKDTPHCICTYKLSKKTIEKGRELYMGGLTYYKSILASPTEVEMLDYNGGNIYTL
tara:strand:+ start:239 stop:1033 length:795 start_codon:yes stop_codon:yes gene_type:complete